MPEKDLERELKRLEKQMLDAAKNLEFEKAARAARSALSSSRKRCSACSCRWKPHPDARARLRAVIAGAPVTNATMIFQRRIGVLFVCMGNICRSPTAEGVFRAVAEREGWSRRLRIGSAGTHDYHIGEPPDARAIASAHAARLRSAQAARAQVRSA